MYRLCISDCGSDCMLAHLRSSEANQQMSEIVRWLKAAENKNLVQAELEELPIGTRFFRLTRARNENDARHMLEFRPTFFATTEEEANKYLGFANNIPTGRLLLIRATTDRLIRAASADQFSITKAIFVGTGSGSNQIGPLLHLNPPADNLPDGLSDGLSLRIQRWIVPIVVTNFLNKKFQGLKRTNIDEININKPNKILNMEFEWMEQ